MTDELKNYKADSFQVIEEGTAWLAFLCLMLMAAFAVGF